MNARRNFLKALGLGAATLTVPVVTTASASIDLYIRGSNGWLRTPDMTLCGPSEVLDAIGIDQYRHLIKERIKLERRISGLPCD